MAKVPCPNCKKLTKKGGYKGWQLLAAICFFPVGMSELIASREPTICKKCGHTWKA